MESSTSDKLSQLSPIGYQNNHCGYCENKSGGSFSYYASAVSLSPHFYEDLICRGWRRSGTILYKPNPRASCCPQYTIRLDTSEFKPTKDQRQALNRFNRYILGDEYINKTAQLQPRSKIDSAKRKTEFNMVERVHESERETLIPSLAPAHDFEVSLEPDDFTEEKYRLFENYQRIVHHEPPSKISRDGFTRFLCSSPMKRSTQIINGHVRKQGSYHQCYRLDGRLVAIGVLDLLPNAISAVYFMYHEEIHMWSPGKLSALREAVLAVEGGCRWYMMGYYIHSCTKMRYKGDYRPQYLLDPESYTWDLLDDGLRRLLDVRKYVSLSRERKNGPLGLGVKDNDELAIASATESVDVEMSTDDNDEDINTAINDDTIPLFARNIGGIMTRAELETLVDLSRIKLNVGGQLYETGDLVMWETASMDDPTSVMGAVADLVAAIGPNLAKNLCITFT